jgi:RimJ/RimL family protein N-acetyltransferase
MEHARWWKETNDHLLVAEVEVGLGRVLVAVGTVRLTPLDDATCEIHLIVAPEQRGKGFSREMLEAGRAVAKELGYTHLIARVDAPNTKSLRAFLREGYTVSSAGTLFLERDV